MTARILAALLATAAPAAFAASQVTPAEPYEFDAVNLRMNVDSCYFVPETVSVTAAAGVIRVAHRPNLCFVPGEPRIVDIRLGTLPIGDWRVEVHPDGDPDGPASERIHFSVRGRPEIAIYPRPPRPLTDYSGHWFRASESGWGLSFHQSPTHVVFAAWYVYDADGSPAWYVIQDGQWTSATRWAGKVYRTSGPAYFPGPAFDPAAVTRTTVGEAAFEFLQRPGEVGIATFTYTVNGQPGSKRITRLAF